MPKLPYMKWYPSDADQDEIWRLMTMEERGLYVTCLNHAWLNDGLPANLDEIAQLFNLNRERFDQLWRRVGLKFQISAANPKRIINSRQEKEKEQVKTKSRKCSRSAKLRGKKNSANAEPLLNESLGNDVPRAYDSESDSLSESSSEETQLESSLSQPDQTPAELDEFAEWVLDRTAEHPNEKDPFLSRQSLVNHFATDVAARKLFETNHRLWCRVPKWTDKNGAFAPKLVDFIESGRWKHPPARDGTKAKDTSYLDALLAGKDIDED